MISKSFGLYVDPSFVIDLCILALLVLSASQPGSAPRNAQKATAKLIGDQEKHAVVVDLHVTGALQSGQDSFLLTEPEAYDTKG